MQREGDAPGEYRYLAIEKIEIRQLVWHVHVMRILDDKLPKQFLKYMVVRSKNRGKNPNHA